MNQARSYSNRAGYVAPSTAMTLVELLFATALVSFILLMLFSLVNSTSRVVSSSERNAETWTELRAALDRISPDVASAVIRDDLNPLFLKQPLNDAFYFYTFAQGYGGVRNISLIGYHIDDGTLQRGAQGTLWDFPSVNFSSPIDASNLATQNYDVLGERIFRMELEFLMEDGTRRNGSPAPAEWSDVSALIVTLAAIDEATLKQFGNNATEFTPLLPDPEENQTALETWSAALDAPSTMNPDPRGGIHLRQRVFPIKR